MTDREGLLDLDDTPEDVATLYSWANLHGAKYRDFSASRAQMRERARLRVQEAIEAERRRTRDDSETHKHVEAKAAADVAIVSDVQRKQETANGQQVLKTEQVRTPQAVPSATPHSISFYQPGSPDFSHEQLHAAQNQPLSAPASEDQFRGPEGQFLQVRNPWLPSETKEAAPQPAWLFGTDHGELPVKPVPPAPGDTLQTSRDRLASRWFALNGLFHGGTSDLETIPAASTQRAPALVVFSLAGGVGKTSLVATLGRALSARVERVLLVDTAPFGILPLFFGARDQRPGVLRTFTAPNMSGDAPIQMISVDPESLGPEGAPQETLTGEISRHARNVSRVIVDVATASGATTRRVLRLAPTVLVPVVPDMGSVVSVSSIDSFFQHNVSASGQPVRPGDG